MGLHEMDVGEHNPKCVQQRNQRDGMQVELTGLRRLFSCGPSSLSLPVHRLSLAVLHLSLPFTALAPLSLCSAPPPLISPLLSSPLRSFQLLSPLPAAACPRCRSAAAESKRWHVGGLDRAGSPPRAFPSVSVDRRPDEEGGEQKDGEETAARSQHADAAAGDGTANGQPCRASGTKRDGLTAAVPMGSPYCSCKLTLRLPRSRGWTV